MDKREQQVLDHIRDMKPLEELYAEGLTPTNVKDALFGLFAPYSENHEALKRYVVECMAVDSMTLASIRDNERAVNLLEESLRIYRLAIATDWNFSLRTLSERLVYEKNAIAVFWSQYHLSHELDALDIDEFVHESLRLIGTMIEGIIKHYLYGLAHCVLIVKGEHPSVKEINKLKLGNVVDRLVRFAQTPALYSIRGVKINQWRNIAQHFTASVHGDVVTCVYQDGHKQIQLSRDELLGVVIDINNTLKALKVGHVIVFFDHLDKMCKNRMLSKLDLRSEASLTNLTIALASQGFRIVDASFTEKQSMLVVQDVSSMDPSSRRIHTTQFVIPLFLFRPAAQITVEYRDRYGIPLLRTSASRALMEKAQKAGDWTLVAREATLEDMKDKQ